jgi:hypothetical protein
MSAPDADAAAEADAPLRLASLPPALTLQIFSLLPVDARARAACLSRGFHAVLSERSAWTRLDLSPSSGVKCKVTDALLRAAAAKAGGALTALDVSGCANVNFETLLALVQAHSGALRELCAGVRWAGCDTEHAIVSPARIQELLLAAPQLRSFVADVHCDNGVDDARRLLRSEPPFQALRVRVLSAEVARDDEASLAALAADVAAHASVTQLELAYATDLSAASLDAVVDAALARRLTELSLLNCWWLWPGAQGPALARLLSCGDALTVLRIDGNTGMHLLDAQGAALLGAALRANSTLTVLSLHGVELWQDADAAATLLHALTAHRSVRALHLSVNAPAAHSCVAGAALGALVAANAPALQELRVSHWRLGDACMRPLVDALPANTHLRALDISYNNLSGAFAADVLLPAVRANTGLRQLRAALGFSIPGSAHAHRAEALVRARGIAASTASA